MKSKPEVGQVLYSLNVGNAARYREQVLTPVVVKSVGRKYFVAGQEGSEQSNTQYYLDTWREKTEFSARSVLYESEKEWRDEREATRICRFIQDIFKYGRNIRNLSLAELKTIEDMLTK